MFVKNGPKFKTDRRTRSWQSPLIIIPIALRLTQMKLVYAECRYDITKSLRKQMKVFRLNLKRVKQKNETGFYKCLLIVILDLSKSLVNEDLNWKKKWTFKSDKRSTNNSSLKEKPYVPFEAHTKYKNKLARNWNEPI